jgi:hypothetical protein
MAAVHQVSTSGRPDLRAAIERYELGLSGDGLRAELASAGLL